MLRDHVASKIVAEGLDVPVVFGDRHPGIPRETCLYPVSALRDASHDFSTGRPSMSGEVLRARRDWVPIFGIGSIMSGEDSINSLTSMSSMR